jgi:hypothetical protein
MMPDGISRQTFDSYDSEAKFGTLFDYILGIKSKQDAVNAKIDMLHDDVTKLKLKAGVWGLVGGIIPVCVTIGIALIWKLRG